jgi:hypothetical protein
MLLKHQIWIQDGIPLKNYYHLDTSQVKIALKNKKVIEKPNHFVLKCNFF